jgi:branched-chain amino acid transport system ATP-binding protein
MSSDSITSDLADATTDGATVLPDRPRVLEVDDVTVRFGGLAALADVSFAIEEGSVFGLIGPNGAGKSTMFNAITGLRPPTAGAVRFRGEVVHRFPPWRIARRGVARTFQNIRLFPQLSAEENVLVARHCRSHTKLLPDLLGLPSARAEERANREMANDLLQALGLGARRTAIASSLPYADQRRLEIARALALEPQLLLLDEPAAGMNHSEKGAFIDLIRSLRERFDLTICLIEHHVPLVMGLCDQVVVLNFGRMIANGPPEAVRNDPAVIEAYLGDAA